MPTYRVTAPDGRTLKIEGDHEPTEAELHDIFASVSAKAPAATAQTDGRTTTQRAADAVIDVGFGALKGAGHTVSNLGQLARKIPGVAMLDRVVPPAQVEFEPENTAQRVGFGGEQIGEFFLPGVGTGGRVAQAAKAAGLTYAQSTSPGTAAVSGALTAVVPGAGAAKRGIDMLREGAQKEMARALGATKEAMKAEAQRLAPQMLERGVKGSRAAMLDQARTQAATFGKQLEDAYQAAAAAGGTVSGDVIRGALQLSADALKVTAEGGKRLVIPGTERVISTLNKLDAFVEKMGADIPVDKAAQIKRTLDRIVAKAGLFGQKVGASATDSADAWALREASNAFREMLNQSPTIAALNKELSFWTGLRKVLTETERRTQAQSGGIVQAGMGGAGAVAGAVSGDSMSERATNAVLGGLAGRQVIRLVQSPWFRTTVAAPAKAALAEALASGSPSKIISATARAMKAAPSLATQAIQAQ